MLIETREVEEGPEFTTSVVEESIDIMNREEKNNEKILRSFGKG